MAASAAESPRAAAALFPVAAVAITAACYANALRGSFIWDDRDLVFDAGAGGLSILRLFKEPFYGWWGCYYRPFTSLSYALQFAVTGSDQVPFHCVNVLAHLVNVGLLHALARRFGASSARAAFAATAWGVFPRLTESVSWISGRTDVLATLCVLAALLAATGGGLRRHLVAAGWLAAGLLFKEVAIAGLPALAVLEYRRDADTAEGRPWSKLRRLIPASAAVAVFLLLRALVLPNQWFPDGVSGLRRVRLMLQSVGTYVVMTLEPLKPAAFIGDKRLPSVPLEALGASAVMVAAAVVLIRSSRWSAGTCTALALAAAALAPVMHLVPLPVKNVASDRFLYLPLAGLAVALATGLPELRSRRVLGAVWLAGVLAIVLLGSATIRRNRAWADEVTFWSAALDSAPADPLVAWTESAQVLFREGRFAASAALRGRILQLLSFRGSLSPATRRSQQDMLAICLAEEGREEEALRLLRERLSEEPTSVPLRTNIAVVELRRLNFEGARRELGAALRSDPASPPARALLATVDRVERDLAALPEAGSGAALDAGSRARRARILEQVGTRRAVEGWSQVAYAGDVSIEDRRAAISFLVTRGPEPEARRAVDELKLRIPGFPGLEDLERALARRRAREMSLDELVKRLHLVQSGGVPGPYGKGDRRVPLRPQGREMTTSVATLVAP